MVRWCIISIPGNHSLVNNFVLIIIFVRTTKHNFQVTHIFLQNTFLKRKVIVRHSLFDKLTLTNAVTVVFFFMTTTQIYMLVLPTIKTRLFWGLMNVYKIKPVSWAKCVFVLDVMFFLNFLLHTTVKVANKFLRMQDIVLHCNLIFSA